MAINVVAILAVFLVMSIAIATICLLYLYHVTADQVRNGLAGILRPSRRRNQVRKPPEVGSNEANTRETPNSALEKLRLQVWRSRRRRVRLIGRVYVAGGLVSLLAGYYTGYFGFELISAVMIPLGVFFAFSGIEPYIKTTLAGQSVVSAMRVLQEALETNLDEGHAVFLPKDKDHTNVRMFIPEVDVPNGSVPDLWTRGHYYTPLGHTIFEAYLREAGGKTETSLPLLLHQLKTITTSGLELVDDITFEINQSEVELHIKNVTFSEIGRFPDLVQNVYCKAGCPVTNSMAEWISYGTNSQVKWLDARIDPMRRTASIRLSLVGSEKA